MLDHHPHTHYIWLILIYNSYTSLYLQPTVVVLEYHHVQMKMAPKVRLLEHHPSTTESGYVSKEVKNYLAPLNVTPGFRVVKALPMK